VQVQLKDKTNTYSGFNVQTDTFWDDLNIKT